MGAGRLRFQAVEVGHELVNAHLADALVVARTDVHLAVLGFLFSCYKDEVPLVKLRVPDLLVQLGVGAVKFHFEAGFV